MPIDPNELTSNRINDPIAETYNTQIDPNWTQYLKYRLVERVADLNSVCLDVGIGNGIITIPLANKVRHIHGVDISTEMLRVCQNRLDETGIHNVTPHYLSATDLQFPDNMFDLVFSFSTLLLVPQPENAYREAARVLKPGGIAVLDITGRRNLSQRYWGRYYQQHGHFGVNAYDLDEIRAIFGGLGLQIVETHPSGLLDQWKYLPLLWRLRFLENLTHGTRRTPDLDYRISRLFPTWANRWYFVLRKTAA